MKLLSTEFTDVPKISAQYCMFIVALEGTHRVKGRKVIGGTLPAQEELLRCMELYPNVQCKLEEQKGN